MQGHFTGGGGQPGSTPALLVPACRQGLGAAARRQHSRACHTARPHRLTQRTPCRPLRRSLCYRILKRHIGHLPGAGRTSAFTVYDQVRRPAAAAQDVGAGAGCRWPGRWLGVGVHQCVYKGALVGRPITSSCAAGRPPSVAAHSRQRPAPCTHAPRQRPRPCRPAGHVGAPAGARGARAAAGVEGAGCERQGGGATGRNQPGEERHADVARRHAPGATAGCQGAACLAACCCLTACPLAPATVGAHLSPCPAAPQAVEQAVREHLAAAEGAAAVQPAAADDIAAWFGQ